jgi:hypothetical protein
MAVQLLWTLTLFFCFLMYTQSVGLLGLGISLSQGRYLHTEQTHTDIYALSGIRTQDPSVRAGEDGSCLRPRVHCDRHSSVNTETHINKENISLNFSDMLIL